MNRCTRRARCFRWTAAALVAVAAAGACAGPGPQLIPLETRTEADLPGGQVDRQFDTDRDGRVDYVERQDGNGRVVLLRYDRDENGEFELELPWPTGEVRHLIVILDSVPYDLVREAWDRGLFSHFHAPSRVISPFPVMTDPCIADFFGLSPCRAVEAQYYDGHRLNMGYGTYVRKENSPWVERLDYYMSFVGHFPAYFRPRAWFDHELRRIQDRFIEGDGRSFIGYCVGTSALGARLGRDGHVAGLEELDRFCRWIIHRLEGRVRITLLSDHGHNLMTSQRLDLAGALRKRGYHVGKTLAHPRDVVIPEYGIVTFAAMHTAEAAEVAGDLVTVEGVDLAAYLDASGDVVVLSRDGRASISRRDQDYKYTATEGDPLKLAGILNVLKQAGMVGPDGLVSDRVLFDATAGHEYPDAVHRLWRAFHGLFERTPDVLVSIHDGYHCGSKFISSLFALGSAHGNLNRRASSGFVMSTSGRVDPVIRMEDLRAALIEIGVPLGDDAIPRSSGGLAVDPATPAAGDRIIN